MSDNVRPIRPAGGSGASPDRAARRVDAEQWLPGDLEIVDEGPPVGSVAVGAFGVGFDLIEPDEGVTQSYDAQGNEVPESLIRPIAPATGYDRFMEIVRSLKSPVAAEPTKGLPGAADAPTTLWAVEGPPEGQEEALENTALPGRVELDGHAVEQTLSE